MSSDLRLRSGRKVGGCVVVLVAALMWLTASAQEFEAQVEVIGAVARPGTIIVSGESIQAPAAVGLVGGATSDAYTFGAVLLRQSRARLANAPVTARCLSLQDRQAIAVVRSLLPVDRGAALAEEIRAGRLERVPVEVAPSASVLDRPAQTALIDGDILIVPPRPAVVYVSGAVKRPGVVPYEPGMLAEEYLKLVGESDSGKWFGEDVMVLPDGSVERLDLQFFNYRPTAVPPGTLLLFQLDGGDGRCARTAQW